MKSKKVLILVLCAVLIATFAVGFSACNKNKNNDDQPSEQELRNAACTDLTIAVLSRLDADWGGLLNDDEVAALENGGDYILSYEWTNLIVRTVGESGLQTAKINKIKDFTLSEDGGKVFSEDVDVNTIAKLMREAGLTADDAKNVAYNLTQALVTKSESVYSRAKERLSAIPLSAAARSNALSAIERCDEGINSLAELSANKDSVSALLADAENGLKNLFAFAYKAADLLAGDEDLVTKLSSGTLSSASDDEIVTYLNGVMASVRELRTAMTDDEVAKVGRALDALCSHLEKAVFGNEVANSAVDVLSYARLLSDYVPDFCDLLETASDFVLAKNLEGTTGEYITLKDFTTVNTGDEYVTDDSQINNDVLTIRAILFALGVNPYIKNTDSAKYEESVAAAKTKVLELYDKFVRTSDGVYEKEIIFVYVCCALNQRDSDKVIGTDLTVGDVGVLLQKEVALSIFKGLYEKYSTGDTSVKNSLRDTARTLISYYTGEDNVTVTETITASWYNEVLAKTKAKIESDLDAMLPAVQANIRNEYIEYLFDEAFDSLADVATSAPVKRSDAEYENLVKAMEEVAEILIPTVRE